MASRRKRERTHLKDDIWRDATPTTRTKKLVIASQLTDDSEGTSELSHSSNSHAKLVNAGCEKKLKMPTKLDEQSTSDVCAICLMPRTDPTLLDNCEHSFCYICTSRWLKHAGKCPLCMKVVNSFWHNLDLPPSERPIVSVAELRAAAEAARLAERGRSLPPLDEQECVRLRIRRLQRRLHAIQEQMSRSTRVDPSSELSIQNVRLVNEISRLDMLKRDVTTRREFVGNIVFRSLIYKECLEWSSIDRNANRVPFSPEVFSANATATTQRLRHFLDRELRIVWRSKRSNESREEYKSKRDSVVSDIILWCSEFQINSPQFTRNIRLAGVYPPYMERFQSELFEFASSMVSLEDFDSMSSYSSKELRQLLRRRSRRAGNTEEVVVLSESDSDSAVILLDSIHRYDHHNRSNDVIVLSDDNLANDESILVEGENNYVRGEAASSTYETSGIRDFYAQPACRLSHPVPMQVMDAFGFSRGIFPRSYSALFPTDVPVIFMNSQPGAPRDEQLQKTPSSSAYHVDNTVVLSSDDDGGASARDRSGERRADMDSQRTHNSSSLSSTETCPQLVDWFNPSNTEAKLNLEERKNDLTTCSESSTECKVDLTSPQPSTSNNSVLWQGNIHKDSSNWRANDLDGPMSSRNKTSMLNSSETLTVQQCTLPEININSCTSSCLEKKSSQYDTANHVGNDSNDSSLCSARAAPANDFVKTECGTSPNTKLTGTTSIVAPISLFKPLTKNIHHVSSETKGENELLASLFQERQQRLFTDRLSEVGTILHASSLEKQLSGIEEQQSEQKSKVQEMVKKVAVDDSEKPTLRTSIYESVLDGTAVTPVVDASASFKSSWNNSDLVDMPSSSMCAQDNLSVDGIQTSSNLNTMQDTMRSDSSSAKKRKRKRRKYKHFSWKFLFKQFRRKLRHERSQRKRKRLYDFLDEMKEKLGKQKDDVKSSESQQNDHKKKDLCRGSSSSTSECVPNV